MSVTREVEVLRAACCIAGLDHDISENESKLLRRLADHAGVGAASLNAMMNRAKRDPNFYQTLFQSVMGDSEAAMKTLLCVAVADHDLNADERVILHHFAEKLEMNEERFELLLAAAKKFVDQKEG